MARKPNPFPVPSLRQRNSSFQVRWFYKGKLYEITLPAISKDDAKRILTVITVALAERHDWPEELITEPAVKRYIAVKNDTQNLTSSSDAIAKYVAHLKVGTTSTWPTDVKRYLTAANEAIGSLPDATTQQLASYLDSIAATHKVARNRAQTALSGFYRWLRDLRIHPRGYNPIKDIKKVREERRADGIVVWEEEEIPGLLRAADKRRDGIAIWIAILAGLRRGEIARLKWTDIAPACINVNKSKTGKKRQVPLSKMLADRLEKEGGKEGKVVPWPDATYGWETAARRLFEVHMPKALPKLFDKHPEKFGWNACRHTFASRHAQRGIPLDVVAAWLGDSPKVCKDHYARYVPANKRDARIDGADFKI